MRVRMDDNWVYSLGSQRNEASNFRPITCVPLMWKLLTAIIADDVYDHLDGTNLLPEGQKGCRRNSRATKDELLIDKAVIHEELKTSNGGAKYDLDRL